MAEPQPVSRTDSFAVGIRASCSLQSPRKVSNAKSGRQQGGQVIVSMAEGRTEIVCNRTRLALQPSVRIEDELRNIRQAGRIESVKKFTSGRSLFQPLQEPGEDRAEPQFLRDERVETTEMDGVRQQRTDENALRVDARVFDAADEVAVEPVRRITVP